MERADVGENPVGEREKMERSGTRGKEAERRNMSRKRDADSGGPDRRPTQSGRREATITEEQGGVKNQRLRRERAEEPGGT
ncbi:hypothetical protein NDU88_005617 [Pleurodeles waltl]|uniref:Uncharacterized protein n=1 Tax=Pleurodeles waltl TaxID=8319 RepID=A0AAV7RLK0_PLEWA|nr:hypothetical protein NDU88_005617 [Pleurodeles waltl]